MKHLFSCLKSYKKETVLAPLFKLLEASLELIVPLVVGAIVNNGISSGDVSYILYGCLILVALGAVGLGFSLTAQYFAARAAVGASAALRERLFCKLQSLSYSQIDETGTSTMITRMTSDINQVQTGVNMTLRLFLRSPFIVFGAMIMAFTVDPVSALVFAGVIPLLALVVFAVMAACIPLYQRVQEKLDKVFLSARENLAGVRVVRAFCKEESETALFRERNGALCSAQKKVGRIAALTNPFTYILVNVAVIALLWAAAGRVNGGALMQGGVISLYGYLSMILVELIKLANLIVTITKAVSCQKRIGKALDNITFSVRRGETVGILGGTGSGKSSLVHLIPRFYEASAGRVLVNGTDVNAIPAEALREAVAIVPQKAVLFRGTVRSNLLWGNGNATDAELLSCIRTAQAEDVVAPKGGLDGEVAQEGKNLSGGQRQRLTIARALVRKPEILILDDSASALDYATDAKLRAALKQLDCTVFIVSQRAASVKHADKIVVLDDGGIAGMGTHKELYASCDLYREIYHTQFKEEDV